MISSGGQFREIGLGKTERREGKGGNKKEIGGKGKEKAEKRKNSRS